MLPIARHGRARGCGPRHRGAVGLACGHQRAQALELFDCGCSAVGGVSRGLGGRLDAASRIFSGQAHFQRNLLIALSGVLVYSLYNEFAQFSAFALTWRIPTNYEYVAMWSILAAVSFFHLREVGRSRLALKGGLVLALLALVIAIQTVQQFEVIKDFGRQNTVRRLLPPALRLVPVRDEKTFFTEIEQLKTKLDSDLVQARADDASR